MFTPEIIITSLRKSPLTQHFHSGFSWLRAWRGLKDCCVTEQNHLLSLTRATLAAPKEGIVHMVGGFAQCLVKLPQKNGISKCFRNKSESPEKEILFLD